MFLEAYTVDDPRPAEERERSSGAPSLLPPRPPPCVPLPWIPTIQCRDAHWSFNTLWHRVRPGTVIPTCHIVASLRNGVPCRCDCPPGCCRGKLGTFYR